MSGTPLSLGATRALTGLAAAAALSFLVGHDGWDPALRTAIKVVPCTVMAALALVGADSRPRRLIAPCRPVEEYPLVRIDLEHMGLAVRCADERPRALGAFICIAAQP